jgi:putative aldouronate transport system substrate-binding protein
VTYNNIGFTGFAAIPASVGRDEDRLLELLRILDYYGAPFGSEEYNFLWFGLEGTHHEIQANGARVLSDRGRLEVNELYNVVFAPRVIYYPNDVDDVPYLQQATADVLASGIDDPTWGRYSPTSAERGAQLSQLGIDRVTSIILGREPMSALNDYVNEWRSRGGDQIREEFQEALAAR